MQSDSNGDLPSNSGQIVGRDDVIHTLDRNTLGVIDNRYNNSIIVTTVIFNLSRGFLVVKLMCDSSREQESGNSQEKEEHAPGNLISFSIWPLNGRFRKLFLCVM